MAFCSRPGLCGISQAHQRIIHKVIHSFGGKLVYERAVSQGNRFFRRKCGTRVGLTGITQSPLPPGQLEPFVLCQFIKALDGSRN